MKAIIPIIILVVFLSILAGANIYLVKRLSQFFDVTNLTILYFISGLLSIFMIAGVIGAANSISTMGHIIYIIAAITMGLLLYLLISTFVVDILRLFTNFKPLIYGLMVLVITFVAISYGTWNSFNTKLTNIEIPVSGIDNDIRIIQLSDVHVGHFRGVGWLQKIVDIIVDVDIDFVVITGDLFDGRINLNSQTLEPLKKIKVPIYFVEGNHDGYSGSNEIKLLLRDAGIIVLENEIANFKDLQIIGLNHLLADDGSLNMHAPGNHSTIKSALSELNINKDQPSLLLHHSPDGIEYASEKGIDVYLAGHTHAGQLFPVNYIAKLLFTYNKGLHDYNGTRIFVSQGVGTFGPPMRIGTISEMSLITLKSL